MDLLEGFYPNENNIEILTPSGFKKYKGIQINNSESLLEIHTTSNILRCTKDHKLSNDNFKEAQEFKIGDLLDTVNGKEQIISIVELLQTELVSDLVEVEDTNCYYTNNILSHNCNFLYLDEFAFVDNDVEFFKSVFPTISSGESTKIAISSTPHGLNLFHKLFKDAKENKNDFVPFEISWDMVPGRDENWKQEQLEILGEHGFRQEYGNEFLGSSNTLISGHVLQSLTWETPIATDNTKVVLQNPKENHNYIVTIDSSRGVGEDYSVAIVIDVTAFPYNIVCTYRDNNIRPILLSNVIVDIAKKYNNAFLLIERNTIGQTVAESCFYDLEYENIFTTTQGKKGQELRNSFGNSFKLGVEMTSQVKRLGSYMLKTLVEERKIISFTDIIVSEFYTFINKNNTWVAETGKNDDMVMSLVLFSWAVTQPFFKDITSSDLRLSLMEEENSNQPISFWVSDGKETENTDNTWLF